MFVINSRQVQVEPAGPRHSELNVSPQLSLSRAYHLISSHLRSDQLSPAQLPVVQLNSAQTGQLRQAQVIS